MAWPPQPRIQRWISARLESRSRSSTPPPFNSRNRWEAWLRVHHFYHHFGHPLTNHGVSIPLWDHVFGTHVRPDKVKVPRRLVMPWLIDEDGEVRPEFADHYELVGATDPSERQEALDRARAFANEVPVP